MTLTVKPAVTTIDGVDYEMELATIGFTSLGRQDHGVFTFLLDLNFGGSGQGAGNMFLGDPEYFGKAVQSVLDFFACDWEHIKGRRVFALKENHDAIVKGLVSEDRTRWMLFSDWRIRHG